MNIIARGYGNCSFRKFSRPSKRVLTMTETNEIPKFVYKPISVCFMPSLFVFFFYYNCSNTPSIMLLSLILIIMHSVRTANRRTYLTRLPHLNFCRELTPVLVSQSLFIRRDLCRFWAGEPVSFSISLIHPIDLGLAFSPLCLEVVETFSSSVPHL